MLTNADVQNGMLERTVHVREAGHPRLQETEYSLEMKRTSGVKNSLQAIDLHGFIKGTLLSNVLHDNKIELRLWRVGIRFTDLIRLLLGTNSGND